MLLNVVFFVLSTKKNPACLTYIYRKWVTPEMIFKNIENKTIVLKSAFKLIWLKFESGLTMLTGKNYWNQ